MKFLVKNTKFKDIFEGTFKCSVCGATFGANEISLVRTKVGMPFVHIFKHKKKDYFLACPICDYVHYFGFFKV
jgi:hypothetical protein